MFRKRAIADGVSLDHIGISAKRAPSPPTTPRAMRRIYRRVCKQHSQCVDEAQKVLMMSAAVATEDSTRTTANVAQYLEIRLASISEQVEDLREILSSPRQRQHLRRSPRKHTGAISPRIQETGTSLSDSETDYKL
jgi:hypothetical protein